MDALVARGATGVLLSFSTKGDIERLEGTKYAGIFEIMMSFFNRTGKPAHIKFHIDAGQKMGPYIDGFRLAAGAAGGGQRGGANVVASVVDVIGPEQYNDSAGTSSGTEDKIGPSRYEYTYLGTQTDRNNFPTETKYSSTFYEGGTPQQNYTDQNFRIWMKNDELGFSKANPRFQICIELSANAKKLGALRAEAYNTYRGNRSEPIDPAPGSRVTYVKNIADMLENAQARLNIQNAISTVLEANGTFDGVPDGDADAKRTRVQDPAIIAQLYSRLASRELLERAAEAAMTSLGGSFSNDQRAKRVAYEAAVANFTDQNAALETAAADIKERLDRKEKILVKDYGALDDSRVRVKAAENNMNALITPEEFEYITQANAIKAAIIADPSLADLADGLRETIAHEYYREFMLSAIAANHQADIDKPICCGYTPGEPPPSLESVRNTGDPLGVLAVAFLIANMAGVNDPNISGKQGSERFTNITTTNSKILRLAECGWKQNRYAICSELGIFPTAKLIGDRWQGENALYNTLIVKDRADEEDETVIIDLYEAGDRISEVRVRNWGAHTLYLPPDVSVGSHKIIMRYGSGQCVVPLEPGDPCPCTHEELIAILKGRSPGLFRQGLPPRIGAPSAATVDALVTKGVELERVLEMQGKVMENFAIEAELRTKMANTGVLTGGQRGGSIEPNEKILILKAAVDIQPIVYSLLPKEDKHVLAAKLLVNLYRYQKTRANHIIIDIDKDIRQLMRIDENFLKLFQLSATTINANIGTFIYTITHFLATSNSVEFVKHAFALSKPTNNMYSAILDKGAQLYYTVIRRLRDARYSQKQLINICDPTSHWESFTGLYFYYLNLVLPPTAEEVDKEIDEDEQNTLLHGRVWHPIAEDMASAAAEDAREMADAEEAPPAEDAPPPEDPEIVAQNAVMLAKAKEIFGEGIVDAIRALRGSSSLSLIDLFSTVLRAGNPLGIVFTEKILITMCENMVRLMIIFVCIYENNYKEDPENTPLLTLLITNFVPEQLISQGPSPPFFPDAGSGSSASPSLAQQSASSSSAGLAPSVSAFSSLAQQSASSSSAGLASSVSAFPSSAPPSASSSSARLAPSAPVFSSLAPPSASSSSAGLASSISAFPSSAQQPASSSSAGLASSVSAFPSSARLASSVSAFPSLAQQSASSSSAGLASSVSAFSSSAPLPLFARLTYNGSRLVPYPSAASIVPVRAPRKTLTVYFMDTRNTDAIIAALNIILLSERSAKLTPKMFSGTRTRQTLRNRHNAPTFNTRRAKRAFLSKPAEEGAEVSSSAAAAEEGAEASSSSAAAAEEGVEVSSSSNNNDDGNNEHSVGGPNNSSVSSNENDEEHLAPTRAPPRRRAILPVGASAARASSSSASARAPPRRRAILSAKASAARASSSSTSTSNNDERSAMARDNNEEETSLSSSGAETAAAAAAPLRTLSDSISGFKSGRRRGGGGKTQKALRPKKYSTKKHIKRLLEKETEKSR